MNISIQLEGGKQLEARLAVLGRKVSQKIIKKAVREAMKIYLLAAKSNARRATRRWGPLLARNIVVRKQKKRLPRGSYADVVRFKSRAKLSPKLVYTTKAGREHFIPAIIEFGRGSNKQKAARPFMRPAFLATKHRMLVKLKQVLWQGIIKAVKAK